MRAIEMLEEEHAVIERVLDLLQETIDRIEQGRPVPEGFPEWAIEFFREFADRCHHAKEEDLLFPLLEQRGIPREGGPVGVMLSEHERGREAVSRMRQALEEVPQGDRRFALAAADYTALLRQHILKENEILFQMARRCLTPDDAETLWGKFCQAPVCDHHRHEKWEEQLAAWEKQFGR